MTYLARFSVIDDRYGLMGVEDTEFEAGDLEELHEQITEFHDTHDTKIIYYMLDDLEEEDGTDVLQEYKDRFE